MKIKIDMNILQNRPAYSKGHSQKARQHGLRVCNEAVVYVTWLLQKYFARGNKLCMRSKGWWEVREVENKIFRLITQKTHTKNNSSLLPNTPINDHLLTLTSPAIAPDTRAQARVNPTDLDSILLLLSIRIGFNSFVYNSRKEALKKGIKSRRVHCLMNSGGSGFWVVVWVVVE